MSEQSEQTEKLVAATLAAALVQAVTLAVTAEQAATVYFEVLDALDAERKRRIKPVPGFD